MTIHDNIDDFLAADLDGELSQGESDALQGHLLECATCRQAHQETKVMNTILEDRLAKEKPDAGFEQRLLRGFRNRVTRRSGRITTFIADLARLRWAQVGAVAAVLLAVVLAGRMVTTGSSGRHSVPLAKAPTEQPSPAAADSSYASTGDASSAGAGRSVHERATTSQLGDHPEISSQRLATSTSGSRTWKPRSALDQPPHEYYPSRPMAPPPPTAVQHLAPEGTLYLMEYISIKTESGVIGLPPGTRVKLLQDRGEKLFVMSENNNIKFEVARDKATNDLDLAAPHITPAAPTTAAPTVQGGAPQLAAAQPSSIQVLQATYGAGTQQMDVTGKVQSLVQSSQPNVRVGNHLFGKDPAFGKQKTLSVVFTSNGVQYRSDIREGEQLSFSNAHSVNATATAAALTVQGSPPPGPAPSAVTSVTPVAGPGSNVPESASSSTPSVASSSPTTLPQTEHRHLALEGTLYMLEFFQIKSGSGVIGVLPGTRVKLLKDLGETMRVKTTDDYKTEFEVDAEKLTNDIDLGKLAGKKDAESQQALADYMKQQKDKYLAEQGKYGPQLNEADEKRAAGSTLSSGSSGGGYNQTDIWWPHRHPFIYRKR